MSFGNKALGGVQGALIFALMLVAILSFSLTQLDIWYRVGIVVFAFVIIFFASLATEILRAQKEAIKRAQA